MAEKDLISQPGQAANTQSYCRDSPENFEWLSSQSC